MSKDTEDLYTFAKNELLAIADLVAPGTIRSPFAGGAVFDAVRARLSAPPVRDDRRLKLREGWSGDRIWAGEDEAGTLRFIDWVRPDVDSWIAFVPGRGYTARHADGSETDHATRLEAHDALIASGSESPFVVVVGVVPKAKVGGGGV